MSFLDKYTNYRIQKDPDFQKEWEESQVEYDIARQVIQSRKKKGLTQAALAELLHTRQSVISRIENGEQNITIDTLKKLSAALDSNFNIDIKPNKRELVKN